MRSQRLRVLSLRIRIALAIAKVLFVRGTTNANYWSLVIKVRGVGMKRRNRFIGSPDGIVRLLTPIRADFVQQLKARDPEIGANIWVGLFDIQDQGAFNIRSDASKMLGERDFELVFDMYVDHSVDDS